MKYSFYFLIFILLTSCLRPAVREPEYDKVIEEPAIENEEARDSLTPTIELFGTFYHSVKDSDTIYLSNGRITMYDEGFSHEVEYDEYGFYELTLLFGREYSIRYSAPNHYTKFIEIDTRFIPDSIIGSGIYMPTDMTLAKAENPEVEELLKSHPIGKAYYREENNDLGWDFEHTNSIRQLIAELENR